jgi:hypothetical protein
VRILPNHSAFRKRNDSIIADKSQQSRLELGLRFQPWILAGEQSGLLRTGAGKGGVPAAPSRNPPLRTFVKSLSPANLLLTSFGIGVLF